MAQGENPNTRKLKKQLQSRSAGRRSRNQAETSVENALAGVGRNDLQPVIPIVLKSVHEIKLASTRTRETTPELLEKLIHSIQTFGLVLPFLIDKNGTLVVGHALLEAAIKVGIEEVKCCQVEHLEQIELEALALALNRTGESGKYDLDKLHSQMIRLQSSGIKLASTGFTVQEIGQILTKPLSNEEDDEDDAEGEDESIISIPGDLFLLDGHRLLNGDSRDEISYQRVLNGEKAAGVFTDPPYHCGIANFVSGLGQHKHEDFLMFAGKESDEEFAQFLRTALSHCRTFTSSGAVIFCAMDFRNLDVLLEAGNAAKLNRLQIVTWNKGSGSMGSLYRSASEFFVVLCNGKSATTNNIALGVHGRDRTSVWTFPGANRRGSSAAKALKDHPTPKPIELVVEALLDVTNPADVVLDPFLGSGTTIIAAEQCGRKGCGIELDPKYVDRAIRRWEKLTGKEAIHEKSGLTFAQLAEQRSGAIDTNI